MVKTVIIVLEGDNWAVTFRWPKVDILRKSNIKNIAVLIIRYISSIARAEL